MLIAGVTIGITVGTTDITMKLMHNRTEQLNRDFLPLTKHNFKGRKSH